MKKYRESIMKAVFLVAACVSILAVVLICGFLFVNGFPAIAEIGPLKFLGGIIWKPQEGQFGILPMIIGSIYATAIAILVGVPIGLLCSVFMAKFCPKKLYRILKPAISLLAGIPSIVYGFFGLVVIVPMMQNLFGGSGKSVLTAGILLGIMILPTIIEISESSIRAVPQSYYEGSLALGATHERSVYCAMLPAAKSGIMAGVICYFAVLLRKKLDWDDALDVWGVHGVGGMLGAVMIGVFAVSEVNGVSGLVEGNVSQFFIQLGATAFAGAYAFAVTFVILKVINKFTPVRVSEQEELEGLDHALHHEEAYRLE